MKYLTRGSLALKPCSRPCRRWLTSRQSVARPALIRCDDAAVVSTSWLQKHLQDVSIIDVRGRVDTVDVEPGVQQSTYLPEYECYLEGHIPGAVFLDWTRDGIDTYDAVPVQLQQDSGTFAAAMEAKGVGSDRPVVVYDSGDGMLAARIWWSLLVHGHPQPLVLEGGFARWQAEGRATELHEPCTLKVYACYEPQEPQPYLRVTAEQVLQLCQQQDEGGAGSSQALLLDTRSPEQFDGQVRRGLRAGRIPGSTSLPRPALLDSQTAWFLPLQEQKRLLQQAGVDFDSPEQQRVVVYCNGGVAACTAALALHRLGRGNWAVYDGSWNEWSSRPEFPVK